MVTEEDLKAIVVHKKYNRKKCDKKDRKRKRSTSASSSGSSESRNRKANKHADPGFIPSRFLKKDRNRSADRKHRGSYGESGEALGFGDRGKVGDRTKNKVSHRSRDERYGRDDHSSRGQREDDKGDIRRDRAPSEASRFSNRDSNRDSGRRRYRDEHPEKRSHENHRRAESWRGKRGMGGPGRDEKDYDPISDEELALLEEDNGIVEIYKELEREMKSKKYTPVLDNIDFTIRQNLQPTVYEQADPLTRLLSTGYSAAFGGKSLTEKIKELCQSRGVAAPTTGAHYLGKPSITAHFHKVLSSTVALSSSVDLGLRESLNTMSRETATPQRDLVVLDHVTNHVAENCKQYEECVSWYNSLAATTLQP